MAKNIYLSTPNSSFYAADGTRHGFDGNGELATEDALLQKELNKMVKMGAIRDKSAMDAANKAMEDAAAKAATAE